MYTLYKQRDHHKVIIKYTTPWCILPILNNKGNYTFTKIFWLLIVLEIIGKCVYVMYVCISYTHIRIYLYSYTHILIYSYTHILIYSYTHILIYSYTHILIYSYTHILIHSLTYIPSYAHIKFRWSAIENKDIHRRSTRSQQEIESASRPKPKVRCNHMPIHSYTHILIYSYTHILTYPCTHTLIYSYAHILYSYTHILSHPPHHPLHQNYAKPLLKASIALLPK